ncbi:MAG: hypothetical protein H6850_01810 [Alphaproteobacteria bacterium]|nr:MAG: hypothetical protein H6850_01810 [Alphaproteobacteria bacterium]
MMIYAITVFLILSFLFTIRFEKEMKSLRTFAFISTNSYVLTATIIASHIGSGAIIGGIESGASYGIFALLGLLGFPIQLILIAFFIAPKKRENIVTIGDFFEPHYGEWMKILTGFIVIIFNLGLIITLIYSMNTTLFFFIGTSTAYIMSALTLILAIHCCFRGMILNVCMSILQCTLMFLALLMGWGFSVYYHGSFGQFLTHIPMQSWTISNSQSYVEIFSIFIGLMLGNALMPSVFQGLHMAETKAQAKMSFLLSGFCIAVFAAFLVLCGMGIMTFDINSASAFENLFLKAPPFLKIFIAIGLLIAILSSIVNLLNISIVALINDVLTPFRCRAKNLKIIIYTSALFFGGLSFIIAFFILSSSRLKMLFFIYKLWGPLFLTPILGIFYKKTIPGWAFFIIMLLTVFVMALWVILGLDKQTHIHELIVGLGANFILYTITRFIFCQKTNCSHQ